MGSDLLARVLVAIPAVAFAIFIIYEGGGEDAFRKLLYAPEMHDPDLLIRTSGEQRISNYLLWQAAYSELHFTDVLWPDFRRQNLFDAIDEFQKRDRRFGAV